MTRSLCLLNFCWLTSLLCLSLPSAIAATTATSATSPSATSAPNATVSAPTAIAQALRRRQPLVLGVVQSVDNAANWTTITDRLAALGLSYQTIDWSQVNDATDFGSATVLLLPNVDTFSPEQLLALQGWMNRGGKVIATGTTGNRSTPGVRWALRSLLGAYWGADLASPTTLETSGPSWSNAETDTATQGGVLFPTSLASQPVATWSGVSSTATPPPVSGVGRSTSPAAAVVATEQTIYLGWQWGTQSAELDESWLQVSLNRYSDALPLLPPTAAAIPTPTAPQPAPAPVPLRPVAPAPAAPIAPARPPVAPPDRAAAAPIRPPGFDPAEQVAPPGLNVGSSTLPITALEAIAMQQELKSLMGRFESALLSANSANSNPVLMSVVPPAQVASAHPAGLTLSAQTDTAPRTAENPVIAAAQAGLDRFSDLVTQREFGAARQQWLQVRQLLWDNFPTDRPQVQPEIRAIWLDRGTIVAAGSPQGLAQVFDRLAAAGINTVFIETVNAGYPIYPSQVAPQQNPLTRHWDPLAAAVALAHDRGMEIHAWVWTFAAGNQVHNSRILNLPADYPGPVLAAHPDWANYDDRGSLYPPGQQKPFLDPANPEVRQYLLALYEEIVTRYDVDGLQLDYIRYPFQDPSAGRTFGYGQSARRQFQQQTGVDPIALSPQPSGTAEERTRLRSLWQQWTEFRIEQVSSFVAEASDRLRQRRPDLVMSVAVFATPTHDRLQEIQQDWETWAQRGDVDLVVMMSYAMDTNRLQRLAGPWLDADANLGSALIVPGIRLLNLENSAVIDQIQALRDRAAEGYALFAVENLQPPLQTVFSRTQGDQIRTEPIPYRDPFGAAAGRFTALQREWSYLLGNGDLWVRDRQLDIWRSQSDALAQALTNLADRPTLETWQTAQQALANFRSQFPDWMYLQALDEGYQVQTWENRLETIEQLLQYGNQQGLARAASR